MRYSPTLVDHFLNPRNAGLMRDADGSGSDEYAGCGDLTRFYLRVREGLAAETRFQAYGCGPTIAAASVATEVAAGAMRAAALDALRHRHGRASGRTSRGGGPAVRDEPGNREA